MEKCTCRDVEETGLSKACKWQKERWFSPYILLIQHEKYRVETASEPGAV